MTRPRPILERVIAGDCIAHALRVALEHLVWALVRTKPPGSVEME